MNVDAIFAQSRNWDCRRNRCTKGKGCGTFLQAVNDETTRIGCGFKRCEENSPFGEKSEKWNFLVCWYNPMLAPRARPFPANKCKIHRGL